MNRVIGMDGWWMHNNVCIFNTAELYTLKNSYFIY